MSLSGRLVMAAGATLSLVACVTTMQDFRTSTPEITAANAARQTGTWTPPPSHAELKALWEGPGTWWPDVPAGAFLSRGAGAVSPGLSAPNPPPLKPRPLAVARANRRAFAKGQPSFDPYSDCHPAGMPYLLKMGGYQAVVADSQIIMSWADQREHRRIYLDGRPHPDEKIEQRYNGFSVAHWDGATMVVETTNIRGSNTQIEPHIPKAEGSYIIERYTPTSPGRFDLEMTMMNPDFTRPWVVNLTLARDPARAPSEALCSDQRPDGYAIPARAPVETGR